MILRTNQTEINTHLISDVATKEIERIVTSPEFPWHYIPDATDLVPSGGGAFVHLLKMDYEVRSPYYDLFHLELCQFASLYGYSHEDIYRARLGLLYPTKKKHNKPHVDFSEEHDVVLWYITENERAPTLFFNDRLELTDSVDCRQGRVVHFPGHILHASTPPKEGIRVVLNVNLKRSV